MTDFLICEHCVAKNELRTEITERGMLIDECKICKKSHGRALSSADTRVKRIFRALIRRHFSEWDYNDHIGGGSLELLVFNSKAIFDFNPNASLQDFEDAFLVMEDDWYPSTDEEIALGGGYWNGGVLYGLRDQRDTTVENIIADCFKKNYFDVLPDTVKLISSLRSDITQVIPAGAEYYRGRIGVKSSFVRNDLSFSEPFRHYSPFTSTEIGRPPLTKATEGRLNRSRVSVLYLASDVQTAICELRPHPGHLISTAKFRLKKELLIANLASHDIRNFLDDERLEILRRILSISDVLNIPIQPDQKELYTVTQLFADAIRESGFDAVSFKSSLSQGINLACFADDIFDMVAESENVHDVTSVSYEISDAERMPRKYDKEDFEEILSDPFSTLMHNISRRTREK